MKNLRLMKLYKNKFKLSKSLFVIMAFGIIAFGSCSSPSTKKESEIHIYYPYNNTLFPPDIAAPTFKWNSSEDKVKSWEIVIHDAEKNIILSDHSKLLRWKPNTENWQLLKEKAQDNLLTISIKAKFDNNKSYSSNTVSFSFANDAVDAPIFFRSVPLPFKFARENLKKISWHLGNVSSEDMAPAVLKNIPVCGNCHSFSPDGKYLAMDVDARDEKGAYVITEFEEQTELSQDKIINWSEAQNGEFTYGLLSQISPEGRYVVSTLKDCEIFVDRHNMEYSQLFFPFKGILQIYDRETDSYFELEGANDTNIVHSNPIWSPDGKYIYFCRSTAVHFEESGIFRGSTAINHKVYNEFLKDFLSREKLFKFDIYRIPFNNGKGGKAEPVLGASNNKMSNYFPKISPDGKWLIFTQAESFMLLQKDSKLNIIPSNGGEAKELKCNSNNMNSWHSWSPNSKWLVFSSKANGPYTQLYLTHIDENGNDSPAIFLENMWFPERAVNIPEFVNVAPDMQVEINPAFLEQQDFALRSAQIKNQTGDIAGALLEFNNIIKVDDKNAEAFHGRGDVYIKLNKREKGIDDFNTAIRLKDNVADYYLSRGIALGDVRKYKEAYSDFAKAIELDAYSFMAYNDRAVLKVREGKFVEALHDYEKSIELNPDAAITFVNRGAAKAMQKDFIGALNDFNYAIQLQDGIAKPYIARSMLHIEQNNPQEALNDLDLALQLEPKSIEALQRRAKLHLSMQNYYLAIEDLDKILNINPELADVYSNRAFVKLKVGDSEGACNDFKISKTKGYKEADSFLKQYCK